MFNPKDFIIRNFLEKHPDIWKRVPSLGGIVFVRTQLYAVKKVLSQDGLDILSKGGYRNAVELAIDRPGLWLPTREKRLCKNRVITDAFVADIVDALQGSATPYGTFDDYKYHDSGTGTGDEAASDTGLGTPTGIARATGTQIEGATSNIYKSVATITYDNTYAITEHGIFNASSSGTLADRTKFAAINVVNTNQIEFTFQMTFTSGG